MDVHRRILRQCEIEAEWSCFAQMVSRTSLNIEKVPLNLRQLVPYAVHWGLADDCARYDVFRKTPQALKENLKWVVQEFSDELDAWLAGPEANDIEPSDAYVAFSAMRMGVDAI